MFVGAVTGGRLAFGRRGLEYLVLGDQPAALFASYSGQLPSVASVCHGRILYRQYDEGRSNRSRWRLWRDEYDGVT